MVDLRGRRFEDASNTLIAPWDCPGPVAIHFLSDEIANAFGHAMGSGNSRSLRIVRVETSQSFTVVPKLPLAIHLPSTLNLAAPVRCPRSR